MRSIVREFLRAALSAVAALAILGGTAAAAEITGAGATFPYPVYAKWAQAYKDKTGVSLNYQSIGSGGGIKQIQAGTVDFGASDMPLKPEALAKDGLAQWPMVIGGVVPVVNVEGVKAGDMKLTGPVLAGIYLGVIKKWNDKAIAELNPGLKLPNQDIAVVYRSDGSGTTFLFTNYLSQVSPDWEKKVGSSTSVEWPTGIGGKGNEGVASFSGQTPGAVGYVEYAYALQNKLAYVRMQSRDGEYLLPEDKTFQAAAANADWAKAQGFHLVLTNQPGAGSWPITGASFIIMRKSQARPERAAEALKFFDWAFASGQQMAKELTYVPIPENVAKLVEDMWAREIKTSDGKPVWTGK